MTQNIDTMNQETLLNQSQDVESGYKSKGRRRRGLEIFLSVMCISLLIATIVLTIMLLYGNENDRTRDKGCVNAQGMVNNSWNPNNETVENPVTGSSIIVTNASVTTEDYDTTTGGKSTQSSEPKKKRTKICWVRLPKEQVQNQEIKQTSYEKVSCGRRRTCTC